MVHSESINSPQQSATDFSSRTAIITGGAQGIGFAVADRLVAYGARVSIWDFDPIAGAAAAEKLNAHFVEVDLTKFDKVQSALTDTLATMGKVDILVNNAGITGTNSPVVDYPVDEWHRVVSINLDAVFYCLKLVVPHMIERNYGRVVNIASISGKEGNANAGAYSAAKAGVIGLTKTMGKELASFDISINSVTPAGAKTAILDQMDPKHVAFMLSKVPRARFVEVDEVASLVAWLCSQECSFSTGAVFDISGGRATY